MLQTPVFTYTSYKELLKTRLSGAENRGQLAAASQAIGCQRPYLSRVLLGDLHLTADHTYNLAQFLSFTPDEREYFTALVEIERASTSEYRSYQTQRLTEIRKKNESLLHRTGRRSLEVNVLNATYFSSWLWSAIHFLTAIPAFQTLAALSDRLGLRESVVRQHLTQLDQHGLVEQSGEKWAYKSGGDLHAEKNNPLFLMHHQNWRQRGLLDAQNLDTDGVHFTAVHALSRADAERIKNLMLDFISTSTRIAGPSESEDCIVITCDFFQV